jgi:hypothetical protein
MISLRGRRRVYMEKIGGEEGVDTVRMQLRQRQPLLCNQARNAMVLAVSTNWKTYRCCHLP